MSETYWFVVRNMWGRIEVLSGAFRGEDGLEQAKEACKTYFPNAEVAEIVWG